MGIWFLAATAIFLLWMLMRAPSPARLEPVRLVWPVRRSWRIIFTICAALLALLAVDFLVRILVYDDWARPGPIVMTFWTVIAALYMYEVRNQLSLRITDRGCYCSFRFIPWSRIGGLRESRGVVEFLDTSDKTILRAGGQLLAKTDCIGAKIDSFLKTRSTEIPVDARNLRSFGYLLLMFGTFLSSGAQAQTVSELPVLDSLWSLEYADLQVRYGEPFRDTVTAELRMSGWLSTLGEEDVAIRAVFDPTGTLISYGIVVGYAMLRDWDCADLVTALNAELGSIYGAGSSLPVSESGTLMCQSDTSSAVEWPLRSRGRVVLRIDGRLVKIDYHSPGYGARLEL